MEGLAEGAYNKALETAKNALFMGLSTEQASQLTGLSIKEIEAIKI